MFIDTLRIGLFEMLFRKLSLSDRNKVQDLCSADGRCLMVTHFITLFLYQDSFDKTFRLYNNCLITRPAFIAEDPSQSRKTMYIDCPIGAPENRKKAYKKIVSTYAGRVQKIVFDAATEENVKELSALYGDKIIQVRNDLEYQNYILDTHEQIALEGPNFASRRKKIYRFNRRYNWTYEDISYDNMDECLALDSKWYEEHKDILCLDGEVGTLKKVFQYYDEFGFKGGMLRIDGKAVAFCIGAPFNDNMFMNMFMKAENEYQDISIVFLHEFMKRNCSDYPYTNDGEDAGVPGLRYFKQNLQPISLQPHYKVTIQIKER